MFIHAMPEQELLRCGVTPQWATRVTAVHQSQESGSALAGPVASVGLALKLTPSSQTGC